MNDFILNDKENNALIIANLCKEYGNEDEILNLLSSTLHKKQIFTYGFINAIESKKEDYFPFLISYMEKERIISDSVYFYTDILFNAACNFNYFNLAKELDNKFDIIKQSLIQSQNLEVYLNGNLYGYIDKRGELSLNTKHQYPTASQKILKSYAMSPLRYNARNFNKEVLDYILADDNEINAVLIEKVLLENICIENSQANLYLVNNDKTRDIIKKSEIINIFLNEGSTLISNKKEVLSVLSMIDLKEELSNNNSNSNKNKFKL